MALDLFFMSPKQQREDVTAEDFVPTKAMIRAREKLLAELLHEQPGLSLEGEAMSGELVGYSAGSLNLHPGYLHLCAHGVSDSTTVQAAVDWFRARGLVCDDPQDAGFGNRDSAASAARSSLESFEDLVGAQLLGVRLLREWGAGIAFDWTLADGRSAMVQFVRFESLKLPELGGLLQKKVIGVHLEAGTFDTLSVFFEADQDLELRGCIYQKSVVQPARRR